MGVLRSLPAILSFTAATADLIVVCVVLCGARDRRLGWSFVKLALCLAGWSATIGLESCPGFILAHRALLTSLRFSVLLLPATLLDSACVWSDTHDRRLHGAVLLSYVGAGGLCRLYMRGLVVRGFTTRAWGAVALPGRLHPLYSGFVIGCSGLALLVCLHALRSAREPTVRLRLKYWLLGAAAIPFGLTDVLANLDLGVLSPGSLANVAVVGVFAYAAGRERLMNIDAFILRATATLLASVAVVVPGAAAVLWVHGLPLALGVSLVAGSLLLSVAISVLLFSGIRSGVERQMADAIFPARRTARRAIEQLSADLTKMPHSADTCARFVAALRDGLGVHGVALYRDTAGSGLRLAQTAGHIHALDPIDAQRLPGAAEAHAAVVVLPFARSRERAAADRAALTPAWEAYVPVRANGTSLGLIALSAKENGAALDDADVTVLGMAGAQLAVALQNAAYVEQIERQKAKIEEFRSRLEAENVALRAQVRSAEHFKDIVGASVALRQVLALVERVAPTEASILITGETGTGKELIARAVHELSPRRHASLVSVNCGAIPPELAESELFGHARGAFTGAVAERPGKFELADGGTIFLDEVADLPLAVQVKLLRVLQERETQRLGSTHVRKLDLRVIAATNRDLHAALRAQHFREDLFYRLAAVPVHVPPLRERCDDIPMLASFFLERCALARQRAIQGFSPEAFAALCAYNWPGNIRELQNVVERAAVLCAGTTIRPEHLGDLAEAAPAAPNLRAALREEKQRRAMQALVQTGGNQAAAARLLGVSRSNFARLLKSLGVKARASVQ